MKSFYALKDFFVEHKWKYIFGILWLLATNIGQLLVYSVIKGLGDDIQNSTLNMNGIYKYIAFSFLLYLIIGVGRYMWRVYIFGTSRKLEYHLRKQYYEHLLTLPQSFFNVNKIGDLIAHGTSDVQNVRSAIGQGTMMLVDSLSMLIIGTFMMIGATNLNLTLISMITFPVVAIFIAQFGKIIYARSKNVQEAFSDLSDITQESFSGIRVIKSFVQEEPNLESFKEVNRENYVKNIELTKISAFFRPFSKFVLTISYVILIIYGGQLVVNNEISLGDFAAANYLLGQLMWPTMALGMVINILQRGAASMDRLNEIFNSKSDIIEAENPVHLSAPKGEIRFKDVSFRYPGSVYDAVSNIDFTVNPKSTLGIIGRTGSGKTTLLKLLSRLMDVDEGSIEIDGVDIRDISSKDLRANISYAPQDNFLFSDTINYNIAFSLDREASQEEIENSAKIANVYKDIVDFPAGFKTIMGERGVTLSGGQKQRVSIARALIKDTPILLIDDSLSAVDTETEDIILENLKNKENPSTNILISHRISTIKHSDEILFLDDGLIIERGTHEELLEMKGQYFELYTKQLLEEKLSEQEETYEQ